MQYTKSTDFANNLGILFGLDNPTSNSNLFLQKANWCPEQTQVVAWLENDKFIADENELILICNLTTTSYEPQEVNGIKWIPLLVAKDIKGNEEILESDANYVFLKRKSLIYKSPNFKYQLEKVFNQK